MEEFRLEVIAVAEVRLSGSLQPHLNFLRRVTALQRFFAKYELSSPYLLCCSDCEPLTMSEALQLADEECKQM